MTNINKFHCKKTTDKQPLVSIKDKALLHWQEGFITNVKVRYSAFVRPNYLISVPFDE